MVSVARDVARVRRGFAADGDPQRAQREKAYHKSALRFHGVDSARIRVGTREVLSSHPDLDRDQLLALARGFWRTGYFDLRSVALGLLDRRKKLLETQDIDLLEELVRESKGWAHVDWLSTHIIGDLVHRHPELKRTLRRWSTDEDFWVRRAAMLTLLRPLRRGEGDFELFARFASAMIEEKEFFIRKAIGWILREVSKKRPKLSHAFLSEHIDRVSGLTLREGSKYLPERQRKPLLARYKAR